MYLYYRRRTYTGNSYCPFYIGKLCIHIIPLNYHKVRTFSAGFQQQDTVSAGHSLLLCAITHEKHRARYSNVIPVLLRCPRDQKMSS